MDLVFCDADVIEAVDERAKHVIWPRVLRLTRIRRYDVPPVARGTDEVRNALQGHSPLVEGHRLAAGGAYLEVASLRGEP
jgi:putative component of toxin-antitoxin plasmid stabilization module